MSSKNMTDMRYEIMNYMEATLVARDYIFISSLHKNCEPPTVSNNLDTFQLYWRPWLYQWWSLWNLTRKNKVQGAEVRTSSLTKRGGCHLMEDF